MVQQSHQKYEWHHFPDGSHRRPLVRQCERCPHQNLEARSEQQGEPSVRVGQGAVDLLTDVIAAFGPDVDPAGVVGKVEAAVGQGVQQGGEQSEHQQGPFPRAEIIERASITRATTMYTHCQCRM